MSAGCSSGSGSTNVAAPGGQGSWEEGRWRHQSSQRPRSRSPRQPGQQDGGEGTVTGLRVPAPAAREPGPNRCGGVCPHDLAVRLAEILAQSSGSALPVTVGEPRALGPQAFGDGTTPRCPESVPSSIPPTREVPSDFPATLRDVPLVGDTVVIQGLRQNIAYNGRTGTITGRAAGPRLVVQMSPLVTLNVRAEHLVSGVAPVPASVAAAMPAAGCLTREHGQMQRRARDGSEAPSPASAVTPPDLLEAGLADTGAEGATEGATEGAAAAPPPSQWDSGGPCRAG